ncbi:MAG: Ni/Fe-hydrogenase, b-type cytochrome subunit [Candidatus Acidiferrales bacterium]
MKKTRRQYGHEAEWKRPAHGQVRVYVWEWPVRFAHWVIFVTIVSLSVTGYYMHSPFVIPHGRTAYVMGTMRFVHLLSGFAFLCAVLIRIVWMFVGNRWSHWDQFIPVTRKRLKDIAETGKYYGFMVWSPTPHIGHNALAGASYAVIYILAIFEVLTGLALYSRILGNRLLSFFVGWLPRLIDIQWLREIHFLIMFVFWMFFIHHLYTAILVSIEEENGVMESIFSGYKFVPEHEFRDAMLEERVEDTGPGPEAMPASRAGVHSSQTKA